MRALVDAAHASLTATRCTQCAVTLTASDPQLMDGMWPDQAPHWIRTQGGVSESLFSRIKRLYMTSEVYHGAHLHTHQTHASNRLTTRLFLVQICSGASLRAP